MDKFTSLPIFRLDIVPLPGEVIPLHIFEERYRAMIRFCRDNDSMFGVLNPKIGSETGCCLRIMQVITEFDDGRLLILCQAEDRFRFHQQIKEEPFPLAEVELLEDYEEFVDPEHFQEISHKVADVFSGETQEDIQNWLQDQPSSFAIACIAGLESEEKQTLLDCDSEATRLALLGDLLDFKAAEKNAGPLPKTLQ